MIVTLGYAHARVTEAAGWERRWLEEYLSFTVKRWNGSYTEERRETVITAAGGFPAGFLASVRAQADGDCVRLEVRDARQMPVPGLNIRAMQSTTYWPDWLRGYQDEGVRKIADFDRGIFRWPTGGGKTSALVAVCSVIGCRWLVLTHRLTLVGQLRDSFEKFVGEEVGQIGDGVYEPRRVTVATFDSVRALQRRKTAGDKEAKKFLESIGGCFIDEVHVVASSRNRFVVSHLPRAYYVYGLSATPLDRGDQKNPLVVGCVGPVIHRARRKELVQGGYLAEGKIELLPIEHPPAEGTWQDVYKLRVVRSAAREKLVVRHAKKCAKPALVFVKELEHGRRLEKALRAAGVEVEWTWGAKKTSERLAAIRRLVHGNVDVLIANVIFQEGVDIPSLRTVILAAAGKSIIAQLQQLGRGSRVDDDKTTFDVLDVLDLSCGCKGKEHRSCRWFEEHAKQRKQTYLREGYSVVVSP